MNKKFFAALASATMAFSATGSLAVFAQDFVDEDYIIPGTPAEKPAEEKTVEWTKENFGDLAGIALTGANTNELDTTNVFKTAATTPATTITVTDGKVKTEDLAKVTDINLPAAFNGEIKGLEYFTKLTGFDANTNANVVLTNTSLDFSANTSLTNISIANAKNLRNIALPEAFEDADGEKSYKLAKLVLDNTKLLNIDLTEQTTLTTIELTDGLLKDIQLPSSAKKTLASLNLKNNMLESISLKGLTALTTLNLDNNHIGTIANVPSAGTMTLGTQTIYVAEDSASVNLSEMYPDFDFSAVSTSTPTDALEKNSNGNYTGVFKLDKTTGEGSYTYNTMTVNIVAANPMYRLYNPNSGEHFYTKDADEQEALVTLGWNDEGYGWVAPKDKNGKEVYRLYNPNAGDHHYTVDPIEKEALVAAGWKYEGIGWYSGTGTTTGVTVYRQYNPNAKAAGAHNYTMDLAENDYLVALGWVPEGEAWKALK